MRVSSDVSDQESGPSGDPAGRGAAAAPVLVAPSLDDPVVNAASDAVGGPLGVRAFRPRLGSGTAIRTVARVLLLLTLLTLGLGVRSAPLLRHGLDRRGNQQYTHMCYTDIPFMYQGRGFSRDQIPYVYRPARATTSSTRWSPARRWRPRRCSPEASARRHHNQGRWFYTITTWFLLAFACITVVALIGLTGAGPGTRRCSRSPRACCSTAPSTGT